MRKIRIGNHLTPYLLLACVLLAGLLAMESQKIVETQEGASPTATSEFDPPERKSLSTPSVSKFMEIVKRPLFISGRKPPPPPKPKPRAPVKLAPLRLVMEGVVILSNEKIAIMLDQTTNQVVHLTTGDNHQGWELISITETVATFKRGTQVQELTLQK